MKRIICHEPNMSECTLDIDGECTGCGAQGTRCANDNCECCLDDHCPADHCRNHATVQVCATGDNEGEGFYCAACADQYEAQGWGERVAPRDTLARTIAAELSRREQEDDNAG